MEKNTPEGKNLPGSKNTSGQKNRQNQAARKNIVTAMMQLIRQKPISTITIQELTELAGVSRMTFYRNYTSREDVFLSHIQDILNQYRQEGTEKNPGEQFYDRKNIRRAFSYFYQYRDFIDALNCCGLTDIFLQNLTQFVLDKWLEIKNTVTERYRLISFVGIMFNNYLCWIQPPQTLTLDELTDLTYETCEKAYS